MTVADTERMTEMQSNFEVQDTVDESVNRDLDLDCLDPALL